MSSPSNSSFFKLAVPAAAAGVICGLLWKARSKAKKAKSSCVGKQYSGGDYVVHRPKYPKQIFEEVDSYVHKNNAGAVKLRRKLSELAVDVGAGTGQATGALRDYYQRVIGVEAGESQRANAEARGSHYGLRQRFLTVLFRGRGLRGWQRREHSCR